MPTITKIQNSKDNRTYVCTIDNETFIIPKSMVGGLRRDVQEAINSGTPVESMEPIVGSDEWKSEMRIELSKKRYEAEIGGIAWGAHQMHTDRESQSKLSGAMQAADKGWVSELNWKFKDGFATVTAADITSMSQATLTHIQTCFNIEANKLALIEAGQDPDIENGW